MFLRKLHLFQYSFKSNCMKKSLLLVLFGFTVLTIQGQKNKFSIADIPDWVKPIESTFDNLNQENTSGYYYHLIDFQVNLDTKSYFSHYTIELLNNEGIQQISDINIDFDPAFQKLIFHKIDIIRNGKIIKKLAIDKIKTAQREANMERFLYDGRLTAFINLTDVRIGDKLEYSYSITGSNPIYENKHHSKIYFQYSIPVGLIHNRILVSERRKLNFKYFNRATTAVLKTHEGINEYSWKHKNTTPITYDTNTPSWYDPSPSVSISEYDSWSQIVEQYKKHYELSVSDKTTFRKKASKLFSEIATDSLADHIRKFVQDEIRYLGFEGGLNSHKPDNPINVLQQRYGDCKAKSFLLSELYKANNIEAYPILVNSYNGKNISDELPSPNLFDHCIVQVRFGDETYYIDPTISNQGGNLENLYVPQYYHGLVLGNGEIELSSIQSTSDNTVHVVEEFDIKSIDSAANLRVTTKYTGYNADDQRISFAKNDTDKIQKQYLNFYSAIYPNIKEASKIELIDNRDSRNELTIIENYTIDSLWLKSPEDNQILICEFYPLSIETYVNLNKSPNRTMPYNVRYPVNIAHETIVNLPEEWPINQKNEVIKGNSFIYSYDINYANKTLKLYHTYKTLDNHIEPEETPEFISKHKKILDELSYLLTYNKNFLPENSGISWILVMISLLIIGVGIYFSIKIYKNYDVKVNENPKTHTQIGGWLILIAIGLVLTPVRMLYGLIIDAEELYGIHTWNYIFQEHPSFNEFFLSLLIVFELMYNSAFIVFTILLIILFFKRRSITPRMMIILYASSFLIITLDTFVAIGLNDQLYSEAEKVQAFKDIAGSFLSAVIWIPYFIISKRVKETFTETYNKNSLL